MNPQPFWFHGLGWLLPALLLLGGCSMPPLLPEEIPEGPLRQIEEHYRFAVTEIRSRPDVRWTYGWVGNAQANTDDDVAGLCWEWQELMYVILKPTIDRVGWDVEGVSRNPDSWLEHHALIVFDPRMVDRESLLASEGVAWVIDPWTTGQAHVYPLERWLKGGILHPVPPVLEDIREMVAEREASGGVRGVDPRLMESNR